MSGSKPPKQSLNVSSQCPKPKRGTSHCCYNAVFPSNLTRPLSHSLLHSPPISEIALVKKPYVTDIETNLQAALNNTADRDKDK